MRLLAAYSAIFGVGLAAVLMDSVELAVVDLVLCCAFGLWVLGAWLEAIAEQHRRGL